VRREGDSERVVSTASKPPRATPPTSKPESTRHRIVSSHRKKRRSNGKVCT
jgi:hypothetical protein